MKAIIAISDDGQDMELGVEFDRILKDKGWSVPEKAPYLYQKDYGTSDLIKIREDVENNVQAAATQAEWEALPYTMIFTYGEPIGLVTLRYSKEK